MSEWPVRSGRFNHGRGAVVVDKQPSTVEERCRLSRRFVNDFGIETDSSSFEFAVDDPEQGDPFEKAYAPWPLRLYLIRDGKMEWIAQPKDRSFDVAVGELMTMLGLHG